MKPIAFIKRGMVVCLCLCLAQGLAFGEAPSGTIGRGTATAHKPMEIGVQGGVQGIGFTYSFALDKSNNFQSISIFLDYQDVVGSRQSLPGGFLRYDYHFSLFEQGRMLLYAGPGAMAGYVTDHSHPLGLVLGLTGNFGFKYQFDRNITLGASLHPVVGYHIHWVDGHAKLNLYQSGLWRTILPEISVRYRFDNQTVGSSSDFALRHAGQTRTRNWTLGVECAYQPTIYNYLFSMYMAEDGSRYVSEINQFSYQHNASMRISAAWHFTDNYQLRLLLGYAGLRPDVRVHDLLLRNQWGFRPVNAQGDRFFAGIDVGCGLNARDLSRPCALVNLSFGYSLAISADSNIEFFIRSVNAYGKPTLYEDDVVIPQDRAYQSQMFISNIGVGFALDL